MSSSEKRYAALKRAEALRKYGINKPISHGYDRSAAADCSNGTFVGKQKDGVTIWRGIPYALQPLGELRWRAPQPPKDDRGVYEAYYNGKTPIQTELKSEQASYYPQGEDCLYLNVWSDTSVKKPKTVMVFFHGGSYGWGGTADPLYDGFQLVHTYRDVVFVTVGYRTGIMGFVDFSDVPGGEDYPDAPNLGILDQIESLRWVQKNISAFGGDADNVTIIGESAGGGSVSLLPVIPAARGLFRRVIAQSGSVALTFSKDECKGFTKHLMTAAGASSMKDLLSLSEEELRSVNEKINDYNNFPQRDGKLIPINAYAPYDNGETADIDFLIGTNADELNYWIGELGGIVPYHFGMHIRIENDLPNFSKEDQKRIRQFLREAKGSKIRRITELYNEIMFRLPAIRQAEAHSMNGGRVFMYYWTHPSSIAFRGACHAVELAYVFGNTDQTIYTGENVNKELSRLAMAAWVQFAKTGDPGTEELKWEPYSIEEHRPTMILSASPHIQQNVLEKQRRLLRPLLRYWLNASYAELSYNVPFIRKTVALGALTAAALVAGCALIRSSLDDKK